MIIGLLIMLYFNQVDQIYELIHTLLKGEKQPNTQRDAITYALNTTLGKTIESFIIYSLRRARVTGVRIENWGKTKYDRYFDIGVEAYIWFGRFLANINYLDEDFTREKIKTLAENRIDEYSWRNFMGGYLSGSQVYKDIYSYMRPNYYKAVEYGKFDENVDSRLVNHIAIGYLYGYDQLDTNNLDGNPSLFYKMLNEAVRVEKKKRWEETVNFFWSLSGRTIHKKDIENNDEIEEETKSKIIDFWRWTYENREYIKEMLDNEDYHLFLGSISQLVIVLNKIDDNSSDWIELCAPYINIHQNSSFFIEYLTKFEDDESIKHIGNIYLKILEYFIPTFGEEDIKQTIEKLYKLGVKDAEVKNVADNICEIYGRRGIHILKDLWDKYNT